MACSSSGRAGGAEGVSKSTGDVPPNERTGQGGGEKWGPQRKGTGARLVPLNSRRLGRATGLAANGASTWSSREGRYGRFGRLWDTRGRIWRICCGL